MPHLIDHVGWDDIRLGDPRLDRDKPLRREAAYGVEEKLKSVAVNVQSCLPSVRRHRRSETTPSAAAVDRSGTFTENEI